MPGALPRRWRAAWQRAAPPTAAKPPTPTRPRAHCDAWASCPTDDAARRAVERTLTGVLSDARERVTRPRGTSRGRTPFRA